MPVSTVIAMLEDGMTETEILAEHPDLEPEDLAECVGHGAGEAEEDSPGFGVKAWLADTDDLPTLEIGIETAAPVQRDRAKRGE